MALNKNKPDRDLPDNEHDAERLKSEEAVFDMPEVSDIPGQENIIPPRMESFADTTISSDDEEGAGLLDGLNEENEDDLEEDEQDDEVYIRDQNMEDDVYLPAQDNEEIGMDEPADLDPTLDDEEDFEDDEDDDDEDDDLP